MAHAQTSASFWAGEGGNSKREFQGFPSRIAMSVPIFEPQPNLSLAHRAGINSLAS